MKIWIKINSDLVRNDIVHKYKITQFEQFPDNEDDDMCDFLNYEVADDTSKIYILYRYFENYIDTSEMYSSLDDATKAFYENIADREIYNESDCHVIEKAFNGDLQSTIYAKNDYDGRYEWVDKGIRWVVKTIDLLEDMEYFD
jgi:hypothetical protein